MGAGERARIDAAAWASWLADALARSRGLAAQRAVIALPELEVALGERLSQLAQSLAGIELPSEIEIAPEPVDAPGTVDWLRGAARRSRPEGLEIRAPNEPTAPQGAPTDTARGWSSQESAGRFSR